METHVSGIKEYFIKKKKRKWFTWRCFRELDPKLNRKITALNICRHSAACLFVCFNLAILFFEHENCGVFRWHFCNQLWMTLLISPHKKNPRSFGYCPKYSQPPPSPISTSFGQLFHYFAKCLTLLKIMGEMIILKSKINYEDVSGGDTGLPELMVKLLYIDFRCS